MIIYKIMKKMAVTVNVIFIVTNINSKQLLKFVYCMT